MPRRWVTISVLGIALGFFSLNCGKKTAADPLFEAARSGDASKCESLIAGGISVDAVDSGGETALNWAVYSCRVDVVRVLLRRGADVNHVNPMGLTALMYTATPLRGRRLQGEWPERNAIAQMLISAGADVNRREVGTGLTALHFAARDKNVPLVRNLIEAGADLRAKERHGWTPLDVARFPDYAPNDEVINLIESSLNK